MSCPRNGLSFNTQQVMAQRRGHVTHKRQRMISHTCNTYHEGVISHMWEFTSSGSERNGSSAYLRTNPEIAQAARKKVLSLLSGARAYLSDRHFICTHLLQVVFRCCSARATRDAQLVLQCSSNSCCSARATRVAVLEQLVLQCSCCSARVAVLEQLVMSNSCCSARVAVLVLQCSSNS